MAPGGSNMSRFVPLVTPWYFVYRLKRFHAGLNITAAQQTTSGHKGILTGQKLHSPVMLTGGADSYSRTNCQILTCKS